MNSRMEKLCAWKALVVLSVFFLFFVFVFNPCFAQIPSVSIPTVTGTDPGIIIAVSQSIADPQINVRGGPGTEYDRVGSMVKGQKAVAKGKTAGGSWILIEYPGGPGGFAWVYSAYIDLPVNDLPIVTIPNTPTPRVTNTIDPTLAAQFIVTVQPTRLATYTQPAPLTVPTFPANQTAGTPAVFPIGLVILFCLIAGVVIGIFTLAQRR